ncbi:MAG: DUF433 domain-containing protein [Syntrophobacteraceae bacterium]|nr:DUF433 domain-containing protein [Syntrophobacteraceae bacterium]
MALNDRVEMSPKIMLGKPVIRGTRITVELIVRKLSEGAKETDLMDAYPHLTVEDIRAALAYAADSLAHEEVIPYKTGASDVEAGDPVPGR